MNETMQEEQANERPAQHSILLGTHDVRSGVDDGPFYVFVTKPAPPLGRFAAAAIALETFLGLGAIGGGLALMAGPNGEILPIPVSALAGSPFSNYFVPGVILFTLLGIGPLGAAVLAWRRHPIAPVLAVAVGGALLIWLVVEIVIVGYSNDPPLQAWYLALGVVIALVGVGWMRRLGWFAAGFRT